MFPHLDFYWLYTYRNPKGNQSWIFIGRTDTKAEASILWPPDAKRLICMQRLIGKDPDAGKDWEQEKRVTEDEMVGWHHWLNGHEFEQTPGDSEGQGSLACISPWGCKESDTTEQLNNNKYLRVYFTCFLVLHYSPYQIDIDNIPPNTFPSIIHETYQDNLHKFWPHELYPTRLLCPWNSPGKNIGVSRSLSRDLPNSWIETSFPTL